MGTVRFLSGFSGPGGSTIAFNTLVNLLNDHGVESVFYGPYAWEGINCKFQQLGNGLTIYPDDVVVYHFLPVKERFKCKKQILSCHETKVFPIKQVEGLVYDTVHYVSESQKEFQGVAGTVIPNPIRKLTKRDKTYAPKVAGIIGSIDPNKRIKESIQAALNDGFSDIRIYGNLTDYEYFMRQVLPLLSDRVTYRGVSLDMDSTYSQLTHVYHSPLLESFNLVKPECEAAGVIYVGNEGNDTKAEYWDNERIVKSWKNLIHN